jgi:hypothetical protein
MDVLSVQQGLATASKTISGMHAFPTLPDAINQLPMFAPLELDLSYNQTFGGLVEVLFTCQVFVSRGDTDTGRKALVGYLAESGSSSIKAALEADKTLGGTAKALIVERCRGAGRLYEVAGIDYLGAQFDVRVWA